MTEATSIIKLDQATKMLAEVRTIDDARDLIDLAEAARVYARQVDLGLEAQNHAAEIKLRAQRRAGEILKAMEKNKGGWTEHNLRLEDQTASSSPTYTDMGINKFEAHQWQTIAALPEEKFEKFIAETKDEGKELTTSGVYRFAKAPHVSHNSGNDEWYTPPQYIEAARRVMGEIDLDPASSDEANEMYVKATTYYTIETNGLAHEWRGRVWMNPPYSTGLIEKFIGKLVDHYQAGNVTEAVVLVNNATETAWFSTLISAASAVVFHHKRVKFIDPNGKESAPLQGQAFVYLGRSPDRFLEVFSEFGWGAKVWQRN